MREAPAQSRPDRRTAAAPWPAGARFGPQGLAIAGVSAQDLASRYGTPLFVLDEEDLRARCRAFRSRFPQVLYAVKALTAHAVIRTVREEGLGLLVATGGELEACLRAGVDPAAVAFHGNNKSDEELDLAVGARIGLVIADNPDELDRLDRAARGAGVEQPVLLRVTPGVRADTHAYLDTGSPAAKFGTPVRGGLAVEAIGRALSLPAVRLRGLHAHVGSQILSADPFLATVDVLLDLLAEARDALGFTAEVLDLGGGFAAVYTDEAPLDLEELSAAVLGRVREGAKARGLPEPEVLVEPGRALVANAVVTLYRVGSVKAVPGGPTFVAVDGGMSDNIRPMLYGARYTVALASPPRGTAPPAPVTVVGKHCESADVLAEGVPLPADVGPGDLLAFAATGAYGYSMASNYNRAGRPAVVAVRDGEARLLLRREDAADLDRLEVPAPGEPEVAAPPGVTVRPARPRDVASYLDLFRAVIAEERFIRSERITRPPRRYRRLFRRSWADEQAVLVAEAGGQVVGSLWISREEHPVNRHVATLGVMVDAAWRRRGVGSALVQEALRWARSVGVQKVSLSVYPHNTAAVALYRKFGFVEEGRLVGHSRKSYGYEDEVMMSRWLR